MDPNQIHPDNLKPSEPVFSPSQTPNEIEQTKKLSKRILLIIFFILAIIIPSALFAYSKLKPAEYKSVSLQTPTPISSPKPSAKAADPTADWQTYSNTEFGYSIKHPEDWNVGYSGDINTGATLAMSDPSELKDRQVFNITLWTEKTDETIEEWVKDKTIGGFCCAVEFTLSDEVNINSQKFFRVETPESKYPNFITQRGGVIYYLTSASGSLDGGSYYFDETDPVLKEGIITFDLILSTLKFTDQTSPLPSATPGDQTLCTQEAKLCPDGSYVSRVGPNCEFAPCP